MTPRIAETIRTLDQKEVVALRSYGLDDEDAAALANALQVNTSVTTIDLFGNRISGEGATALARRAAGEYVSNSHQSRSQSTWQRRCNGAC
jgi:hypothetical protein